MKLLAHIVLSGILVGMVMPAAGMDKAAQMPDFLAPELIIIEDRLTRFPLLTNDFFDAKEAQALANVKNDYAEVLKNAKSSVSAHGEKIKEISAKIMHLTSTLNESFWKQYSNIIAFDNLSIKKEKLTQLQKTVQLHSDSSSDLLCLINDDIKTISAEEQRKEKREKELQQEVVWAQGLVGNVQQQAAPSWFAPSSATPNSFTQMFTRNWKTIIACTAVLALGAWWLFKK